MNLFPDLTRYLPDRKDAELPVYREWAYDFQNNRFLTRNGQYYLVDRNEALKIWIYKALKTPRYRYQAYSRRYGQEYEWLVGEVSDRQIFESELERYTEEALLVNPYILTVGEFSFRYEGARVYVRFTVDTVYGAADMEVDV